MKTTNFFAFFIILIASSTYGMKHKNIKNIITKQLFLLSKLYFTKNTTLLKNDLSERSGMSHIFHNNKAYDKDYSDTFKRKNTIPQWAEYPENSPGAPIGDYRINKLSHRYSFIEKRNDTEEHHVYVGSENRIHYKEIDNFKLVASTDQQGNIELEKYIAQLSSNLKKAIQTAIIHTAHCFRKSDNISSSSIPAMLERMPLELKKHFICIILDFSQNKPDQSGKKISTFNAIERENKDFVITSLFTYFIIEESRTRKYLFKTFNTVKKYLLPKQTKKSEPILTLGATTVTRMTSREEALKILGVTQDSDSKTIQTAYFKQRLANEKNPEQLSKIIAAYNFLTQIQTY